MTSPILEQQAFDIDAEFPGAPEHLDEAFLGVAKVGYIAEHILEGLREKREAGESIGDIVDQAYIDELDAVCEGCESILDHPHSEAIMSDLTKLDDETLRDVIEPTERVAAHFGIDVDLPTPDGSNEVGA